MKNLFSACYGLFLGISVSIPSFAQDSKIKPVFGVVSPSELNLTHCSFDSGAFAMVLFDIGETKIDLISSKPLVFKRHFRIKIFDQEAIRTWSDFKTVVERNSISKIQAMTINLEDGVAKQYPVIETAIFKKRLNKFADEVVLTFPKVKEGSILDLSYTYKSAEAYIPSWTFQHNIPVSRSEYSVDIPPGSFLLNIIGPHEPIVDSKSDDFRRLTMHDLPAFKKEPLMQDPSAFISALSFYNAKGTWGAINDKLLTHANFGAAIEVNNSPFLHRIVTDLTATLPDTKSKVEKLCQYVKANVTWNGVCDYYADDLKKVVDAKKGSSGDINILLAAMLKKAGIETNMVLLSTRKNGVLQMGLPTLSQCNYVVCLVTIDDKPMLLDATEKLLPFNVIPERCLNYTGFMVSKKEPGWIHVLPTIKARTISTGEFSITPGGELVGKLSVSYDGYSSFDARKHCQENSKEKWIDSAPKDPAWEISKSEVENLEEDLLKPLKLKHELTIRDHVTQSGNILYVLPFVDAKENQNPFKDADRKYPVDLETPLDKRYLVTFTIPSGYEIESVPKNQVFMLPDNAARYSFSASQNGDKLSIVGNLVFNQTLFPADKYKELREFYTLIIAKQSEQIVLKKKI